MPQRGPVSPQVLGCSLVGGGALTQKRPYSREICRANLVPYGHRSPDMAFLQSVLCDHPFGPIPSHLTCLIIELNALRGGS